MLVLKLSPTTFMIFTKWWFSNSIILLILIIWLSFTMKIFLFSSLSVLSYLCIYPCMYVCIYLFISLYHLSIHPFFIYLPTYSLSFFEHFLVLLSPSCTFPALTRHWHFLSSLGSFSGLFATKTILFLDHLSRQNWRINICVHICSCVYP